jgi:hypothetical protein
MSRPSSSSQPSTNNNNNNTSKLTHGDIDNYVREMEARLQFRMKTNDTTNATHAATATAAAAANSNNGGAVGGAQRAVEAVRQSRENNNMTPDVDSVGSSSDNNNNSQSHEKDNDVMKVNTTYSANKGGEQGRSSPKDIMRKSSFIKSEQQQHEVVQSPNSLKSSGDKSHDVSQRASGSRLRELINKANARKVSCVYVEIEMIICISCKKEEEEENNNNNNNKSSIIHACSQEMFCNHRLICLIIHIYTYIYLNLPPRHTHTHTKTPRMKYSALSLY